MLILSLPYSSRSKFSFPNITSNRTNKMIRRNPAVVSQAGKVFMFIAQALEAETLQGGLVNKVVEAAKELLVIAGLDPAQILQQLSPETQQTVRAYFG